MAKIMCGLSILFFLLYPSQGESRYFLGTKTGWSRTGEVFLEGSYNTKNLFLVPGINSTIEVTKFIGTLKDSNTYGEDISAGIGFFDRQMKKSVSCVPDNGSLLLSDFSDIFKDTFTALTNASVLTPAVILYKSTVNIAKTGGSLLFTVGEPVYRVGIGTFALIGYPLTKPVLFTGRCLAYTGVSIYGYGSSAIAGGILLGLTSAVFVIDVVTFPIVSIYKK